MKKGNHQKTIRTIFSSLFMLFIFYLVFHHDYQAILKSLRSISLVQLILLLLMGTGYVLLDVFAYYVMMRSQFPDFTFKMAFDVTMLGTFANTSTSAAGTIPLQSYYLHCHNIPAGAAISTMIFECVFHKTAVLLCAITMILFHINWVHQTLSSVLSLIRLGLILNFLFIVSLTLFCTNKKIQQVLLRLNQKLPDRGRLASLKQSLASHSQKLLSKSSEMLQLKVWLPPVVINIIKLLWVFSIPFICMKCCNLSVLSFTQSQTLTAILFLIAGIIINIAGMGPTEFTFLLLFTPFIGRTQASSCLVLYRIAQYFWPFLLSAATTLKIKNEMKSKIEIGGY